MWLPPLSPPTLHCATPLQWLKSFVVESVKVRIEEDPLSRPERCD